MIALPAIFANEVGGRVGTLTTNLQILDYAEWSTRSCVADEPECNSQFHTTVTQIGTSFLLFSTTHSTTLVSGT
jgi:hypothetical protein